MLNGEPSMSADPVTTNATLWPAFLRLPSAEVLDGGKDGSADLLRSGAALQSLRPEIDLTGRTRPAQAAAEKVADQSALVLAAAEDGERHLLATVATGQGRQPAGLAGAA